LVDAPSGLAFSNWDCDAAGTFYFHTGIQGSYRDPILKLSTSDNFKLYKLPADGTNFSEYGQMSVAPDGTFWLALSGREAAVLLRFNSDGEVTSRTKLDQFANFVLDNFVALNNDAFYIDGFPRPAGMEKKITRYAAMVNASGQKVSTPKLDLLNLDPWSKKILEGGAAAGSDGNLYLLKPPQEVVVVSESGEVLRQLRFSKPDAGFAVRKLSLSGGLAAIWFMKPDEDHRVTNEFLVIEAVSGKEVGRYTTGPELGHATPLCFSRQDGFTLLGGIADGKMKLITAALQ
jgi:hypothetical protein